MLTYYFCVWSLLWEIVLSVLHLTLIVFFLTCLVSVFLALPWVHARIQRGGGTENSDKSLKNHKNIGFLSNTGPDPLKNYKAAKPAFNVGPSSARQRNAIKRRADDGPLIVVFGSSLPSSTKKNGPPLTKLSGSAPGVGLWSAIVAFPCHARRLFFINQKEISGVI